MNTSFLTKLCVYERNTDNFRASVFLKYKDYHIMEILNWPHSPKTVIMK